MAEKSKKSKASLKAPNFPQEIAKEFAVVGLGGSAGSLGPFEQFFVNLPAETGMAYVVVQHLSPDSESLLPEIISRNTCMKVLKAEDKMKLEPNKIYVIPPNKELFIKDKKIQLTSLPEGLHYPIDKFFKSLAEEYKENAIGIIFSGMGSDGTEGVKAIKQYGGTVLAQSPESATFDSMPKNVISTGNVDYVLPAEDIPEILLSHFNHVKISQPRILPTNEEVFPNTLQKIINQVKVQTGHDFSLYKVNTISRRIERRMMVNGIEKIVEYYRFMLENPREVEILFKELLIGVTNFFRDSGAFEKIKNLIIPELVKFKTKGDVLRVWIAGCSTGEEAYSMAIIISEYFESQAIDTGIKIQIFATDLDEVAIEKARMGIYSESISKYVSEERLKKWFIKKSGGYLISKPVRQRVIFAQQSLIKDPPFTKLDLVSCRNLLIYLSPEVQKKIMSLFHYALNPNGFLFLGSAEGINGFSNLFVPVEPKWRLFKRRENSEGMAEISNFPLAVTEQKKSKKIETHKNMPNLDISNIIQKSLLDKYAPASVIINRNGDILYINGNTSKYLQLPTGQANLNIFNMCSQGLQFELENALKELNIGQNIVVSKKVRIKTNTDFILVNLTVKNLDEFKGMHGMLIVIFEDQDLKPTTSLEDGDTSVSTEVRSVEELEKELAFVKQQYQQILEEMEASLEELTSVNEEAQSTNEELQSANEELTTSKEEMQSLNEELAALNAELQTKMNEYSQSTSDLKNLFYSTQIATIFLDKNLVLKNFTPPASKIIKIISSDIGRPVTDLALNLNYDHLLEDVNEVLNNLMIKERQVQTFDQAWYAMRISPYKTIDNYIDGVVITFTEITIHKKYDEERYARQFAEDIINTVREPLIVLDNELKIISVNTSFYEKFKVETNDTIGQKLFDLGNGQWNIPKLRELLLEILPEREELKDFKVEHNFPSIGSKAMLLNARTLLHNESHKQMILLAIEEVK